MMLSSHSQEITLVLIVRSAQLVSLTPASPAKAPANNIGTTQLIFLLLKSCVSEWPLRLHKKRYLKTPDGFYLNNQPTHRIKSKKKTDTGCVSAALQTVWAVRWRSENKAASGKKPKAFRVS